MITPECSFRCISPTRFYIIKSAKINKFFSYTYTYVQEVFFFVNRYVRSLNTSDVRWYLFFDIKLPCQLKSKKLINKWNIRSIKT